MKKERFNEMLHNYASAKDEIGSLSKLARDYPYSQVLHLLLANASKKEHTADFKPRLKNAAFYSTDRSILKSLIETNKVPSEPKANPTTAPSHATNSPYPLHTASLADTEALVNSVLKNLEILQQTKKEAEAWLNDQTSKPKKKTTGKTVKKAAGSKSTTSKRAQTKTTTSKTKAKSTGQTKTSKTKKGASALIEKFIKEEPSISKNKAPTADKEDMARQSSTMREDIVSESLAKIYIKQGKIEKAIDIYKKLIWKLPQKKALFAAQIEKLKKK